MSVTFSWFPPFLGSPFLGPFPVSMSALLLWRWARVMHPNATESVVEQLTSIAQNLLYPASHPLAGQKILDVAGETNAFTFTDEGWTVEREVLKQLLGKYRWGEK